MLGRVGSDTVTTLASGVYGSVRRIETAFDGQGNAYLVTSYDAASSGNVVNQVQRAFNSLGQLTTEWQSHSGAVNTSTSTKVQYAYAEMPYLPPDSPDLNPIELAFTKIKARLRAAGLRTIDKVESFFGSIHEQFKPEECRAYIRHAGDAATH